MLKGKISEAILMKFKGNNTKIIGVIIGLVGVIIAIILLVPGLSAIWAWTEGSNNQTILSGYLILAILIAWVVAIVGVVLGFITERYGGLFFIVAAGICIGIFSYCFIASFDSPAPSVYSFVTIPFGGILYLVGGIITIIGEKK